MGMEQYRHAIRLRNNCLTASVTELQPPSLHAGPGLIPSLGMLSARYLTSLYANSNLHP